MNCEWLLGKIPKALAKTKTKKQTNKKTWTNGIIYSSEPSSEQKGRWTVWRDSQQNGKQDSWDGPNDGLNWLIFPYVPGFYLGADCVPAASFPI